MKPSDELSHSDSSEFADLATNILFEKAPDGIIVVDETGSIQLANKKAEDLFGYTRAEMADLCVEDLVPITVRGRHVSHREAFSQLPTDRPMGIDLELRALRKDGTELPVEISLSAIQQVDRRLTIAIIRDMTGHKRLQSFGVQALRAMEVERQRIALELHDETLQELAALLIHLGMAQRQAGPHAALLGEVRQELTEVAEGIRRIAGALRPPELEAVGVASAIRSHARQLNERTGLRITVQADDSADDLSADDQLALYRIVQEAISNSLKHAPNSRVQVRIAAIETVVVAVVEDDGEGFDVRWAMARRGGLGLVSMIERARHAAGRVDITSEAGMGTVVTARFNLPSEQSDA
ncbi:MAG: PAS domain S-box protein [Gemmatimonadota bacterium]